MEDYDLWKVVFLIPKGVGCYRRIVLVEAVWKVAKVILNRRLTDPEVPLV